MCGLGAVFENKLDETSRAVLLLKAMSIQARVNIESQHVANLKILGGVHGDLLECFSG